MALFGLTPQKDKAPPAGGAGAGAAPNGDILDVTDASFMADVIEESRTRPVVIDFWAPWCGPCRQLGPALERAVTAAKGKVRLAKVDIDKNPAIAQQFRVQSIPAVFVIDGGKAFQGFTGALPESQVKAFVDELAASSGAAGGGAEDGAPSLEEVLQIGAEVLAEGDAPGAAQAYAQALQMEPGNVKAIAGLARCYLVLGDPERAAEIAAMAPADAKDAELSAVRAQLALQSGPAAEDAPLRARLEANADDHQARFDLAAALSARGDLQGAADALLELVRRDRGWNEDAARKQLLTVFEAAGPTSEVAKSGRRRLSSLMFS